MAAAVLQKLEVSLENIRLEIEKLVQPGPATQIIGDIPFTPRAKKALELAAEEARLAEPSVLYWAWLPTNQP